MPTAQATGMMDTVTFPRSARGRSRTLVAELALFLLFGGWVVVSSDNTRLRTLVTAKAASYFQAPAHDVALRASPLPDGRSPRVEVRDQSGSSYYVADFNNPALGFAYAV